MIKVTVLLKDEKALNDFLKTNKVEEYIWRKGEITIDLTKDIKQSMAAIAEPVKEETPAPKIDDNPAPAASSSSLF